MGKQNEVKVKVKAKIKPRKKSFKSNIPEKVQYFLVG